MKLELKIAWRNIFKHKGKSFVIGIILFIGALLMTLGNAVVAGMDKGLQKNIVNMITGDIVLISDEEETDNVLMNMMSGKPKELIEDYDKVKEVLTNHSMVENFLPAGIGYVFIFNEGSDFMDMYVLGFDKEQHKKVFGETFKIVEGRDLKPGERGVMISTEVRKMSFDFMDKWFIPEGGELIEENLTEDAKKVIDKLNIRDNIVFMGFSSDNTGTDVRASIKGIHKYKALNKIWGFYGIVDIETFRECFGYVTGTDNDIELSKEQEDLLAMDDMEDLFSEGDMFDEEALTNETHSIEKLKIETKKISSSVDVDQGAYNCILTKLKPGTNIDEALKDINKVLKEKKLNVRAVSWRKSIGIVGDLTNIIRGVLFVFILFIFFVAIIVIMNTLSMTALERVPELAMMRAIGARKGFIAKMFISETFLLSFFFGGLGILFGVIISFILGASNITTDNDMIQLMFGGDRLLPIVNIIDIFIGIVQLGIVTLLSVLYPLKVVNKIVPLEAMSRD